MSGPNDGDAALLSLRGVCRSFGTTKAVREVDFDVVAGTVHALLGENGAGKSTLMNVVYGVHPADRGTIAIGGEPVRIESPRQALERGISMVHQHHQLIPSLTVAESIALASRNTPWRYDRRSAALQVTRLASRLELELDPEARVGELSLGDRQRLEIISAIDRDSQIIILDEPTAVLAPTEVEPLFDLLRGLADDGRAIILITHRMREVFAVSDAISVMRKGELVATLATSATDPNQVLDLVIPQRHRLAETSSAPGVAEIEDVDSAEGDLNLVAAHLRPGRATPGPDALVVDALEVAPAPGTTGLCGLSLTARQGEILGVIGVEGNGQHELVEVLAGIRIADGGHVVACGEPQTRGRLAPHTAVVPEDRHREALVLDLSSEENLVLPMLDRYSSVGLLSRSRMRADTRAVIEDYAVVTASATAPTRSMSGGNQQKLVLARALAQSPKVLVVSQATRGLDPGATAEVLRRLRDAANAGTAVVFIGSDLDEVVEIADRAVVMYGGRIVGESADPDASRDVLAGLMVGADRDPARD
ncbi:ABC transporter ATP-binding protein [Nocardioides soli]|uniref:Simple sugar transport system ATP-binding protein n=1 Tax=Nocardioides soli TaxID=1036020 RepID=A0A7W4Z180_9ACTN|nr:ABC transporter ATP-binding protein [Nocardioides soli]MBB3043114.1 simple sugar transport system ATP-binding protein [Nocardioides soli]